MYIDPGVGSVAIAFLIGIAASIPVLIKMYGRKIIDKFRHKKGGK